VDPTPTDQVPDDPAPLTELIERQAAARGGTPEEMTHLLRMALAVAGIYVSPFPPSDATPDPDGVGGGVVTVTLGQGADSERGYLAGLLASVADRGMPGTDPADVARGYAMGVRRIAGRGNLPAGEDSWWTVVQHRAAVSAKLAQLPYPDGAATPNPESQLADELAACALQMAAQAATIRLLLHIPPDVFTNGDEPAIDRIQAALETYRAESLASDATLDSMFDLLMTDRDGC
jgi:hypothetical protein